MNKLDFLRTLDKELSVLDKEERQEILAFYEERFYSGTIYENKTEIEVINELEEPEVIAKNVLEEYGVSPKFVKTKEERYSNVSVTRLVWLVIFDLLVVSWLIPTLYSVVVSLFGSLISYVGVIGLLFGSPTFTDQMLFLFASGVYILIFLLALVVLDLSIWSTKKIFIYHANVLKFQNREKMAKKLNGVSVDEWFKKHKILNLIKSLSFIGAIVLMVASGIYLFTGDDNIFDVYGNKEQLSEVTSEDLTQDIFDGETWNIMTDFDNIAVEIHSVNGDEITITHTYTEESDYTIDVDTTTNVITISNDVDFTFSFFKIADIFAFLNGGDKVVIEVPENLLLDNVGIQTLNGSVEIRNVSTGEVSIDVSNGKISLDGLDITGDIDLDTSNGDVIVKNIEGRYKLNVRTSNGGIFLDNNSFYDYDLYTSNGRINAENLNVLNQDGVTLKFRTSNGKIIMNEVYVDNIDIKTTNGDIDFYNIDTDFLPSKFVKDTSNGDVNTNVR